MVSDARPRVTPWVNPEHVAAALRELIAAWDSSDDHRFFVALLRARELMAMPEPPEEAS